jgi:hypothetical protein
MSSPTDQVVWRGNWERYITEQRSTMLFDELIEPAIGPARRFCEHWISFAERPSR